MKKQQQILELKSKLGYNKSRIFKRAHYLVKTLGDDMSTALTEVWAEEKRYNDELRMRIEGLTIELYEMYKPRLSPQMESEKAYNLLLAYRKSGLI